MLRTRYHRFLGFPDFFQIIVFTLQTRQLVLNQLQTLERSFVFFALHRFTFDLELNHAPFHLVHDFRPGIDLHFHPRCRLVDQINGLVRQKTVGNIAMRQLRRRDDGWVGNLDTVVHFVFFLQPAQNGDGVFNRRLIHQHLLKTPLQRGILLDVFTILIQCSRADTMQLTARERRFEHITRVHCAFGFACADHSMQFVNKQNNAAFILRDFLEYRFQAFFKLAPVFGTRQQPGHVQHQHALVLQGFRYLAVDDALRQSFHNGGLADARFTDQHRVVFGTTL